MSAVSDAAQAISAAIKTVPGVRVYTDPGANMDPPGAVVGPPQLFWDRMSSEPNRATFNVLVVTAESDRMMTRLWELVPAIAEAIQDNTNGAVDANGAAPLPYGAGGSTLPSYTISITIPLGD